MTVPRDLILERLALNVDGLIESFRRVAAQMLSSEVVSPFRSTGSSGHASPFVKALFPEIKAAATLERSLNTALGWGWDKIVADIARATHGNGSVGYYVDGTVSANAANLINDVVTSYTSGTGHPVPKTTAELGAILAGAGVPGARETVHEKDDAFYLDSNGLENHVEIKTPKPNYDQMRAAKRRILRIHAVRHPTEVAAFVGMPYNPNGRFGQYAWPTTPLFLDTTRDLLVGEQFWNHVGNSADTYDELLDCFYEISRTRRGDLGILLDEL